MRERILMAVAVAMVLCTAGSATAGITVVCNGSACGGTGPRDYWYEVTTDQQYDSFALNIITGDGTVANYSNTTAATLVEGVWEAMDSADYLCNLFGFFGGTPPIHTPVTAHGGGPVAPNGSCTRAIFWTVNGPLSAGTYGFGYNNDTDPMDVGWLFESLTDGDPNLGIYADWSKVVGMGKGPVHGPSPEPATLSLLAVGIGGLMLRRRRG